MIDTLIDKQDTFEIVRDKIAQILADESASQVALATAAGKPNPDDWKLRILTERANPLEMFLNFDDGTPLADTSPVINIWYDGSNFDMAKSNIVERQGVTGTFNIDVYAYGQSADDGGTGHIAGDEAAAKEAQRALRLTRNILMSAEYIYLKLKGTVWQRWIQSATQFQPQQESVTAQNISGARLNFQVTFNEFSPQITPVTLETVNVELKRAEDGTVLAVAEYDYT